MKAKLLLMGWAQRGGGVAKEVGGVGEGGVQGKALSHQPQRPAWSGQRVPPVSRALSRPEWRNLSHLLLPGHPSGLWP